MRSGWELQHDQGKGSLRLCSGDLGLPVNCRCTSLSLGKYVSKCWRSGEVRTLGWSDPIATVRAIKVLAPNENVVI